MRCYLIRKGHIAAVEVLGAGPDEALVEQARALFEKRESEFEGFEVWDCARFVYRYPELPPKYASVPATEVKPPYHLYLLGDDGILRGNFDFHAESDEAAYEIAALAFEACSDRAVQFELWRGSRPISPTVPAPMTTCEQVVAIHQAHVVALEERICDSHWAVSSSERLLARLKDLKAPLPSADQGAVR